MIRRFAFVLIALLALALFARPLLRGEVLIFRDHSDYFQPLRYFTAEELRHFRLPLWNPYNASGEPWLANPQTGVFYPPAWLFLLVPFATAYVLFSMLHLVLLGCGAFLFFSRFASDRAALLGSIMLIFCGPTLSLLDISNNLTTFAWIPLVLWCAWPEVSPAAGGAAIAMSFLAGEPFFAAAAALAFAIIRRRNIINVAITAIFLAGVELIPFLAIVIGSDRAGAVPPEEILRHSMPISDWARVALPMRGMQQQFIPVAYVGVITVLLALVGVFAAIRNRAARAWIAVLLACMVISAGSFLSIVGGILSHLPVTIIRYPSRVLPLAALAIVALAVIGWDGVARAVPYRSLGIAVAALVIADLVPHIAPLLESAPFNAHPLPYSQPIGRDGKIVRFFGKRAQQPRFDRRAWISGYLNLFDRRFDAWTAAPLVSARYTNAYEAALTRRDRLDAMSIQYVLAGERIPALPVVARAGEVLVHRDEQALPLAYWRGDAGQVKRATTLAFTPSAVHVDVDAPGEGAVIVTQQDARDWEVEVDGARAVPLGAGVFRAVRVVRGHHAITWRYRPRALMLGSALTIIAMVRLILSSSFVKSGNGIKFFFSRDGKSD
jgi:hypothetical protein